MPRPTESSDPVLSRIAALVALYRSAAAAITNELTNVDVSSYNDIEAMKAGKKVDAILGKLSRSSSAWAARAISLTYGERAREVRVSLSILGARREPRFNTQEHQAAVASFYTETMNDLRKANASIKRTADSILLLARQSAGVLSSFQAFDERSAALSATQVNTWAAEAVTQKWSRDKLSWLIKKHLQAQLSGGKLISIKGRSYSLNYYAEMVARTELRRAQSKATDLMCEEYANDLVEFSRHANSCEICRPHEGRVFSRSGRDPNYPRLSEELTPPLHPNCGHSIGPTSREAIEYRKIWEEGHA